LFAAQRRPKQTAENRFATSALQFHLAAKLNVSMSMAVSTVCRRENSMISEGLVPAAGEVIACAITLAQQKREKTIAQQDEMISQGNLAGAIDSARAYHNAYQVTAARSRLTLSASQQNKVGWFVNTITFGFNLKAQNVCFAAMRELLVVIESEEQLAQQRLAALQSLVTV
jgi:hypothetical protein